MQLYFSPLSGSLATRIAIYEAALDGETTFHNVGLWTKRMDDGGDYRSINAKGQVPALVTRDGDLLTETAAVLQYVADLAPGARLAPPPASRERYVLQQWLSFIGTEVHKQVFHVFYNPGAPAEAKQYVLETLLPPRFDHVAAHLANREHLVGETFSVADAYLVTCLNWVRPTRVDLDRWPSLAAYHARMITRPHVRRAFKEELAMARG